MTDLLSTARVAQSIGSLRDLVSREGNGLYHFPIPTEIVNEINKLMNIQTPRMVVQIPRGGIVGILDFVRNKVLDWSIEMERSGVLGDGFTFNATEVESAKTVMTTFNSGSPGPVAAIWLKKSGTASAAAASSRPSNSGKDRIHSIDSVAPGSSSVWSGLSAHHRGSFSDAAGGRHQFIARPCRLRGLSGGLAPLSVCSDGTSGMPCEATKQRNLSGPDTHSR
ncbi:AbiTii domain-containing protein [Aliiroseovarius zhejiangensis]|uniref:AbiTii domain-containing protein n=1 Tax=Aliiroseovarius zhejiangensis TaxID=1632025 RepID=UPI00174E7683|nr:hypothetical protein [Aliiroseovarius zhejiangensis]